MLLDEILGIALGALMLHMPGITAFAPRLFVATRSVLAGEWLLALSGALSILFVVLLFAMQGAGLLSLVRLIDVRIIAIGLVLPLLAIRLRRGRRSPIKASGRKVSGPRLAPCFLRNLQNV